MASGQNWTYDAAGNVTVDPDRRQFTYDGENKQIEAKNSGSAVLGSYYFDGDGKRVKKVVPNGETTIFVYDAGGKLIGEYSTIVQSSENAKVQYLTSDNLGTPRINTDANGAITSRSDHMPYGEEIVGLGGRSSADKYLADDVRRGFTGYEDDDETKLNYAQARMYSSPLGRFSSPDPYKIVAEVQVERDRDEAEQKLKEYLIRPQGWNPYAYVTNNPYRFTDPSGEEVVLTGTAEEQLKALARFKAIMGEQRMALVKQTTRDGNIVLSIDNDAVTKMQRIGDDTDNKNFSLGMAEMLNSTQIVEFRIAEKFTDAKGNKRDLNTFDTPGAVTVSGDLSTTGNIQIFVSARAGAIATEAVKSFNQNITNDGKPFYATNEMVDAHEFGHAWDRMRASGPPAMGAKPSATDNSVSFENAVRSRNPQNSQRRTKH